MAYAFKTQIASKNNYGGVRALNKIKYIVIHYTGNDGDTDENNGKYFKNNIVKASAHYFVDDDSVTQSVPDKYVAWSVGGNKYSSCSTTGGGKFYGTVNNTNSIS
ncbi:MAG: N-acetylmuramoyl-L-alanine amidase, partial [Acutalibacteraceae bacterium]|nr:N-acetylmuramoyl-L-alanine amidase [Acutalibacteraceae bacterium]